MGEVNGLKVETYISQLVLDRRLMAHMSQQAFAKSLGISRTTEYRWEHGIGIPSITNVGVLAKKLKLTPQELHLLLEAYKANQTVVPEESGTIRLDS